MITEYDYCGGSIAFCLPGFNGRRFDDFLFKLPPGENVFSDGMDYSRQDVEREESFQRGVRLAVANVNVGNYCVLSDEYGQSRSKAKTDAHIAFCKTGIRERHHQLEIDYWRGAHHTAYKIKKRMLDILDRLFGDDQILNLYLAELPKLLPTQWRIPDFPLTTDFYDGLRKAKPNLLELMARASHRRAREAELSRKLKPFDENRFFAPGGDE